MGDITYLPVGRKWRFLEVVMDQGSRRIVAWAPAKRRDARLTRQVFDAAYTRRRPGAGLIFPSDRGSEYVAAAFRDRLRALAVQQSAAQRGPKDNAHMESFFHSLKAELIDRPCRGHRGQRPTPPRVQPDSWSVVTVPCCPSARSHLPQPHVLRIEQGSGETWYLAADSAGGSFWRPILSDTVSRR